MTTKSNKHTKDGCDYARLTGPLVAELTNDANIPYIEVGFNQYREPATAINYVSGDIEWKTSYKTQCSNYNTDVVTLDGFWTFAKIAGFMSLVFGGAGTLFVWFASCFRFSKTTWRWAGYEVRNLYVFVCIFLPISSLNAMVSPTHNCVFVQVAHCNNHTVTSF